MIYMFSRIIGKVKNIKTKQHEAKLNKKKELFNLKQSDTNSRIDLIFKSSFKNDFIRFCIKYHIYENILFYHDILLYKRQLSDKMKRRLSLHIHEKYIKSDAQHEINICDKIRYLIEEDKNSYEKYDGAFHHVKDMLAEQINIFLRQMDTELNKT